MKGITRSWEDGYSFSAPFGRVPLFLDLRGGGRSHQPPSSCFLTVVSSGDEQRDVDRANRRS